MVWSRRQQRVRFRAVSRPLPSNQPRHRYAPAPHWLRRLVAAACAGAFLSAVAGGCATETNTLEPLDEDDANASAGSSGAATVPAGGGAAGSKSNAGKSGAASVAGSASTAFGGTSSTAGSGGKAAGGNAGAATGGSGGAGTAGQAGSNQGGGSGAAAGGKGGSGGSATAGCAAAWQGDACDTCTAQVQSDKLACVEILNCYVANACGPTTCGNNDDKCGANKIGKGTAGYPIANQVYDCICN